MLRNLGMLGLVMVRCQGRLRLLPSSTNSALIWEPSGERGMPASRTPSDTKLPLVPYCARDAELVPRSQLER